MGAMDARRHQGPRPPSVKDSLGRREGSGLVRSGPRPRREKLRQVQVLEPGDIARRHFGETTMLLRRSEEHTSELQSLMRISFDVFCLKKNKNKHQLT